MRFRQMVIGDDEVNADAARRFRRLKGADTGIHADDDFYAASRGPFDHVIFNAVAFLDPVRDMKVSRAATKLNRGLQDDDSGGSVHVIVAINQRCLPVGDGRAQALNGGRHARA